MINKRAASVTIAIAALLVGVNWGSSSLGTIVGYVGSFLIIAFALNIAITRGRRRHTP